MKKWLAMVGLLFGLSSLVHAGTPLDQGLPNGPYSNSSVYGSTTTGTAASLVLAAPSSKNGVPGRYCFDELQVVGASSTLVYFVDGSTTPTNTNNFMLSGLTTTTANTLVTPHLEPICFTAGNSVGIYANGVASLSYAGFITYGGAGGSTVNAGY